MNRKGKDWKVIKKKQTKFVWLGGGKLIWKGELGGEHAAKKIKSWGY